MAAWAADCAERVLGLFEAEAPGDSRPRDAITRARTPWVPPRNAAKAAGLAAPDRPEAVSEEICRQLGRMSALARAALRQLPAVGENSSGPLGPGLASGLLGTIIRDLQASLADPEHAPPADRSPISHCAATLRTRFPFGANHEC